MAQRRNLDMVEANIQQMLKDVDTARLAAETAILDLGKISAMFYLTIRPCRA